ncbi:MAG: GxxExxY protein [Chthoniobacterales bacterium]
MPHATDAKVATVRENEIAERILDAAFKVHTALGPGLLESVYEVILALELRKLGLAVERQRPIAINYDGLRFDEGFRADLLVENLVIVELKSIQALNSIHAKQVLTQLRLANLKLGLLINFGEEHLKNGIKRIANGLRDESDEVSF